MRTFAIAFIGGIVSTVFTTMLVLAWTGPTSAPPNGNVDAPINVGTTDQIKNAGLGLNSLAVFGNAILSGTSRYLNFGIIPGADGFGIRNNNGTMEFRNSAGSWSGFLPATGVQSINFADGTTQTTAASAEGATDPGTLCGLAFASDNAPNCYQPSYSSIASCAGQSIASSCPSGYTQRTITTATVPVSNCTGVCYPARYCLRTCAKN